MGRKKKFRPVKPKSVLSKFKSIEISPNELNSIGLKVKTQCGKISKVDNAGKTYCHLAVADLKHRLLFGVSARIPTGKSSGQKGKQQLDVGRDFFINDSNETLSLSSKDVNTRISNTKKFVCQPWKRGIDSKTPKHKKDFANKRYGQCLRGVSLVQKQLKKLSS